MPYCGNKARPDAATNASQCKGQVRAFGRRVVPDQEARGRSLLSLERGKGRRCGLYTTDREGAVQEDCSKQWRLYGLLPIVESEADLSRRSFLATRAEEYASLPSVRIDHPLTRRVYEGDSADARGKPLVFVSVVWSGLDEAGKARAAAAPKEEVGAIGYAFGFFAGRAADRVFHIMQVYVNPAYRKGRARRSTVSSLVVGQMVSAVASRARALYGEGRGLTIAPYPDAPCFQLGHPHHLSDPQSDAIEAMYVGAGFDVIPLPHMGRNRRSVELRVRL